MNNAYIRVSSDKSTVENQRFEIINYCNQHNGQMMFYRIYLQRQVR